jgi:tripeptidyl-peptidase-1
MLTLLCIANYLGYGCKPGMAQTFDRPVRSARPQTYELACSDKTLFRTPTCIYLLNSLVLVPFISGQLLVVLKLLSRLSAMFSKIIFKFCISLSFCLHVLAVVHEKLAAIPSGWTIADPLSNDSMISLSISLAQQNLDQLEPKLYGISTPGDAEYGQHLDYDDIILLFGPTAEAKTAVASWLREEGISKISTGDYAIDFTASVGTINTLLNTSFQSYENNGVQKIRTTQYAIPDDLVQYIDVISPTVYFGKTASQTARRSLKKTAVDASQSQIDASCLKAITPPCLKEMYNVGSYQGSASSGSRVAFGSFLNRSSRYSDLQLFEQRFNISSQNFSVKVINGGVNDQNASVTLISEPNLDVQSIIGISHPLPVTEFITGGLA